MKPLNADNPGCDPISSNCVIWQGPDLDCIGLCKGDSISQVVEKLAKELCAVLTSLNMDSYDISCLAISGCKPETFQALIQIIIDKICALEGINTSTATGTTSTNNTGGTASEIPIQTPILSGNNIPDAVVRAPETFWYKNNLGDTITDFQIVDLATKAATMIDQQVGQINTINRTLENHTERIDTLERAPAPELALPNLSPVCVAPATPLLPLDEVTKLLEQDFCSLQSATGNPAEIYTALAEQCLGLSQAPQLANNSQTMAALPGWISTVTNMADSYTDMWKTVCDMRSAIVTLQSIVLSSVCDDLTIVTTGVLNNPNDLKIYLTGNYPTGFSESDAQGSLMTITDSSGAALTTYIPIIANLNNAIGFTVDLTNAPPNGNSNLTISIVLDFTDGESQCQKVITDTVISTEACPVIQLNPSSTDISYAFTYLGGAASLSVKLFAVDGVTELQDQTTIVTGPETITDSFTGLVAGIQYKVQLQITPNGAPTATLCPFSGTVTLQNTCIPPNSLAGTLIIS